MWWPDSDQLWHRLDTLINGGVLLVLDLRGVEAIDSTGIKTLLQAQRAAAQRGATLRLTGPSAQIMRLLTRGGVADLFDIRPDPGSALTEYEPTPQDHVTVEGVSTPIASSESSSTAVVSQKSAKPLTTDDTSRQ
jgi:anti-anti-sigma factor